MKPILKTCLAAAFVLAQSVMAQSWHTYHGDYTLAGVSAQKFTAKPTRLWRTRVGKGLASPVVGGAGRLFCIADDTTLTALDTKGAISWTRSITLPATTPDGKATAEVFSAPPLYVHKALLVVAAESGTVYGISPKDGTTLWTYSAGASIQGAPNFAASKKKSEPSRVFVITQEQGILHAVNAADGSKLWKSAELDRTDGHIAVSAQHVLLGNCSAAFLAVAITDGKLAASIPVGEECEIASGVAASGHQVFSGNRSGSLAVADLKKEALVWINEDSEGEQFATPAVTDTHVVFLGGDSILYCLARTSGEKKWSKELTGDGSPSPVISGDLVITGVDGTIAAWALKDGAARWALKIGDDLSAPAIVDGMIIVSVDDGFVAAYGREGKK